MKPIAGNVARYGEFQLIDRLRMICGDVDVPGVIESIGDDTAILKLDEDTSLLATCDIQVENVHFRLDLISSYDLGCRAIAVNASDIAAMGGEPWTALVSLAIPGDVPVEDFDRLFEGMRDEMARYGGAVVGGNLAGSADGLVIDVFMLGKVASQAVVRRAGARVGDTVCVTGMLGSSAAGLDVLQRFGKEHPAEFETLVASHIRPLARVDVGHRLARPGLVSSMIDISDSLASDAAHICEASNVGMELLESQLPFDDSLRAVAKTMDKSPLDYVLYGGENYELLFTVPEPHLSRLEAEMIATKVTVTRIGSVLPHEKGMTLVTRSGEHRPIGRKGWDHFPNTNASMEE